MKNWKINLQASSLIALVFLLIAADHIDAPAVSGGSADITDFYAFQGENTENLVFVANLQGLMSPTESAAASFDEGVLVEFNIDTNADAVEDLVIQAIPRDGKMYFFGPEAPTSPGTSSSILTSASQYVVDISSYGQEAIIATEAGVSVFAGPRDDPFFMDFAQYGEVISGNAAGFNDPGADSFAGTNVMSIAIEVPKSQVGGSGTINTWVESKRLQ
ncbi:MAG: DUF4331 family protein [Bacteroidia bacterium]|nr:DUF4331 family protein [Bacteroidia bacterium]